ncbi:MAG: ABC transporter ATP-binding protein/permease [Endomicrobium sp.]|jgi:subfamily B ATP-binding cassette protein MsbA|nr:ABC transporter ATP-binding protein/permease [Endomicrobium sp.]
MKEVKRFLIFFKPYKIILINIGIATFVATIINLIPPWLIKLLVDDALPYQDLSLLNIIVAVQLFVFLNSKYISVIEGFLLIYVEQKVSIDINKKLYEHVFQLPLKFYENNGTGDIIHLFMQDIEIIRSFIARLIVQVSVNFFVLIVLIVILLVINLKLSLICIFIVFLYGINANIFKNRIFSTAKDIGEKTSDLYSYLYQNFSSIKEIKILLLSRIMERKYLRGLSDLFRLLIKNFKLGIKVGLISDIFPMLAWVCIISIGGREVMNGALTIGALMAFVNYLERMYEPIKGLSDIYSTLQASIPAMKRVLKIMDKPKEFRELKEVKKDISFIEGKVEFRSVNFGYIKDRFVLNNINLKIDAGKKIAVVGPSGSGKSTLVNLLVRFYDITSGSVYIDGINIRQINLDKLRNNIGLVSQGAKLFPLTIKENIRLGKRNSTDDEIIEAAKLANAHDFINSLSDGYDTMYGEKGILLSGGETQRVILARAIL